MKKITRADLIGHKLDLECHKAKTTTNEYGPNDKRVYCYGLYDDHTENLCSKCSECKAYVYNSTPLRKELTSKELQALKTLKAFRLIIDRRCDIHYIGFFTIINHELEMSKDETKFVEDVLNESTN